MRVVGRLRKYISSVLQVPDMFVCIKVESVLHLL
jgi:hypothetical protein